MARAPFQVVVLPFRLRPGRGVEYAVFRRSDDGRWQGIAGGGEDAETPDQAARREAWEEARIPAAIPILRLQAMGAVPVACFSDRDHWPADLTVVPEYAYGADAGDSDLVLSDEHTESRWADYRAAHDLLHYQSNRTALSELDERLRAGRAAP